jgi:hypothetical protein
LLVNLGIFNDPLVWIDAERVPVHPVFIAHLDSPNS